MQDFVGVKDVISKSRLRELGERKNGPGLFYLATHGGSIIVNTAMMAWTWGSLWCIPFFLLQGVLINFLYAPEHECDHQTCFKTPWLNQWVARICGFIIFNPSEDHRWGHYSHHRHTQDWDKDIELGGGPFHNVREYLWMLSGMPLIYWKGRQIIRHAAGLADDWYFTPKQAKAAIEHSRWSVAIYVLILVSAIIFQSWWWLYYWIGPFVLMRWTYMLEGGGEHRGLTHQSNTLFNTRTWDTNWFARWLNWNMTYHAAHHTFPSVPFHRLPELQREIELSLGYELPKTSYFRLHYWHLRKLSRGKTEFDISAETEAPLIKVGRLPSGDNKVLTSKDTATI